MTKINLKKHTYIKKTERYNLLLFLLSNFNLYPKKQFNPCKHTCTNEQCCRVSSSKKKNGFVVAREWVKKKCKHFVNKTNTVLKHGMHALRLLFLVWIILAALYNICFCLAYIIFVIVCIFLSLSLSLCVYVFRSLSIFLFFFKIFHSEYLSCISFWIFLAIFNHALHCEYKYIHVLNAE